MSTLHTQLCVNVLTSMKDAHSGLQAARSRKMEDTLTFYLIQCKRSIFSRSNLQSPLYSFKSHLPVLFTCWQSSPHPLRYKDPSSSAHRSTGCHAYPLRLVNAEVNVSCLQDSGCLVMPAHATLTCLPSLCFSPPPTYTTITAPAFQTIKPCCRSNLCLGPVMKKSLREELESK